MSIAFNFNTAIKGKINQIDGQRGHGYNTVDVQLPVGETSCATVLSFMIVPCQPAIQVISVTHEITDFTVLPVDFHPFTVEIKGSLRSTVNYIDENSLPKTEIVETPFTQNVTISGVYGHHLAPDVAIYILSINQDFKEDPHLFPGVRIWVEVTLNFTVQALQTKHLLEGKKKA